MRKELPTDIIEQWKQDSTMDLTNLSREGERIYTLHGKYLDLWELARQELKAIDHEQKRLRAQKHQFLLGGPTKETNEMKWEYPTRGKILRNDLQLYADADKELQDVDKRYYQAQTNVEALEYVLDAIKSRSYLISRLIERERYTGGG